MSGRRDAAGHIRPWLGIIGAVVGWGASHQVGSNAVFDSCGAAGGGFILLVCAAGLIVAALGGVSSYGVWHDRPGQGEGRRFIGLLGALLAALAAFAIVLQMISPLILSPCAT
jgi:hypothetical protein